MVNSNYHINVIVIKCPIVALEFKLTFIIIHDLFYESGNVYVMVFQV
jgi:hypothetical protein